MTRELHKSGETHQELAQGESVARVMVTAPRGIKEIRRERRHREWAHRVMGASVNFNIFR